MKLFTMEIRRFFSRRSTLLFAAAGLLFLIGSLAVLSANTHAPTADEIQYAQEQAELAREQTAQQHDVCVRYWENPEDFDSDDQWGMEYPEDCDTAFDPSQISESDYLYGVLSFASESDEQIAFLGAVFILCGLLMASSFIGAEWTSGGMTNLLLWRPQRTRVYTAKLSAALVGVVTLTLTFSVLHLGALWGLASVNGEIGTLDNGWWSENLDLAWKMFSLVVLATICAGALAFIGRRTVAAIGAIIGYGLVFEFGMRFLGQAVDFNTDVAVLSTYVAAWVDDGISLSHYGTYPMDGGYFEPEVLFIPGWVGGVVLLGVTAALTAAAATLFARRDTT